ncbi:MAG: hypothetical protein IJZ15_04210 [Oscillospiraceae bacterium]|nr:hypothetical protein [Oscillospiraceae bacterium]
MSYQCHNCGAVFEEPYAASDRHGFTYGPCEEYDVCPSCRVAGMFSEIEEDGEVEDEELLETA